ncbi:MAG: ATP-binding protein [Chloroflexota bacterium]
MSSAIKTQSRFVSLRWRLILPTFVIVLILAMSSSYIVARSLPSSADMSRVNILRSTGQSVSERAAALYDRQQADAQQLAQTPDLAAALQAGNTRDLQNLVENFARRADLDSVILMDSAGQDVIGLMRDSSGAYVSTTLEAAQQLALYSSTPVTLDGEVVGLALAGTGFGRLVDQVRGSAAAEVGVYDGSRLLAATVDSIPNTVPAQYVGTNSAEPFQALALNGSPYLGSYFLLNDSQAVVAVFVPDNAPFAAEAGQQLIALTLATVAGGIVIALFVMTNVFIERLNKVRQVAEALADGDFSVRTGMQPTDEIGALGHAIDLYTEHVQERHDTLRASLRRQRREIEHLNAVLESLPDGVIIEDLDGNVTLINERAKRLVGSNHNFFKRAELKEITAAVTDTLGPAYAPGLYSLGTPQRIELDGKMLRVQSFAIVSLADQRVGTVIVVRDATVEVQRERARAALIDKMSGQIDKPVSAEVAFSRELKRNVGALQKLIVEMRELVSSTDAQFVQHTARNMPLETLIWAVANEWKQVAQAANVSLNVSVERPGLHIVGDERRLRWALGNIVDNAIKYTPPGGKVSLEIKDEENGLARLRVRDNGVGIASDELPHVFTRFFRGTPVSVSGRALRVPGTGQGLTVARQIIETLGGKLYLRSSVGVGTAVYFTLPLSAAIPLVRLRAPEEEDEEETLQLGTSPQSA